MCREQCAAVMQTHSAGYFAAAVRQLPPAARITLCNVLQVPTQPVSIRIQSDRITQVVSAALCGAAATQAGGGPGCSTGSSGSTRTGPPAGGVGRIRSSGPGSGGSGTRKVRRSGGGRRIGSRWGSCSRRSSRAAAPVPQLAGVAAAAAGEAMAQSPQPAAAAATFLPAFVAAPAAAALGGGLGGMPGGGPGTAACGKWRLRRRRGQLLIPGGGGLAWAHPPVPIFIATASAPRQGQCRRCTTC